MGSPPSSVLTLDCAGAPGRLCGALAEALSAAHPEQEIMLSGRPGSGPHLRLQMSLVAPDALVGRLVREEPGGRVRATPVLEVRVMDRPGGLPGSVWAEFARVLLEIGYSEEEEEERQ